MKSLRRMLLVALAVLGVTAFSASAAQAFEWEIEGTPLSALGGEEEIVSSGGPFVLKSKIGLSNVTIQCNQQVVSPGNGAIFAGGTDAALVEFKGECKVVGAAACTVVEPILAETETELFEAGGVLYDRFDPVGEKFTTVVIQNCGLAGNFPVTGNIAGKTLGKGVYAVQQPLTFSPAISEASGTELKFGANKATLEGTALNELSGANAGAEWTAE